MDYSLVGIVEHQGSSLRSGHYVAYVQRGLQESHDSSDEPSGQRASPSNNGSTLLNGMSEAAEPSVLGQAGPSNDEPGQGPVLSASSARPEATAPTPSLPAAAQQSSHPADPTHAEELQSTTEPMDADAAAVDEALSSSPAQMSRQTAPDPDGQGTAGADGSLPQNDDIIGVEQQADGPDSTEIAGKPGLDWYCISDTHVKRVSQADVAGCEAYLLLYMRA